MPGTDAPPRSLPSTPAVVGEKCDVRASIAVQMAAAEAARVAGKDSEAEASFRGALDLASARLNEVDAWPSTAQHLELLETAARLAFTCGETDLGQQWVAQASEADRAIATSESWAELRDINRWPDAWLIASARRDPPCMAALDVLVDRYWRILFARCRLLAPDQNTAADLAQHAWCRMLRARQTLKPGGNLLAYLTIVATNLWRDTRRSARRAGLLADEHLASLDESRSDHGNDAVTLANHVPDPATLDLRDRTLLKMDLDRALEQLSPLYREVLVARFVAGESCASIGARHGRTEQSISGWVRQAVSEMKRLLAEPSHTTEGPEAP